MHFWNVLEKFFIKNYNWFFLHISNNGYDSITYYSMLILLMTFIIIHKADNFKCTIFITVMFIDKSYRNDKKLSKCFQQVKKRV